MIEVIIGGKEILLSLLIIIFLILGIIFLMLRNRKMKRKIKMLEREIGPETLLVLRGDEK